DHLNGVEELLMPGLGVDTIVLPLMDALDRLIAFSSCHATARERSPVRRQFYQAFIVDPAAALNKFKPRRIIFVRRGSDTRERGRPEEIIEPSSPQPSRIQWALTGQGQLQNKGSNQTVIDDTLSFAIKGRF